MVELLCGQGGENVGCFETLYSVTVMNGSKLALQSEHGLPGARKPSIVGMYPPSFQRGKKVPPNMELFCFPDDDVLVKKMQRFPLAAISSSSTGCV